VLLANHGVLVFHRTPELAIQVGSIVEEAAQAGINAGSIGGPVEIPEELRAAALQRAMVFESRGTAHAWSLAGLHVISRRPLGGDAAGEFSRPARASAPPTYRRDLSGAQEAGVARSPVTSYT
jgi:hypothetical protein